MKSDSAIPREESICIYCGMNNTVKGMECCEDCIPNMVESSLAVIEHAQNVMDDLIKSMERDLARSDELGWTEEQKKQVAHTMKLMEDETANKEQLLMKVKETE